MDEHGSLERKLIRVGHTPADEDADADRKRGIMARIFGDPAPPRRIGRFIDLGLLGHGAMGTVRRAYDEHLAREVAIKVIRHRSTQKRRDRLLREAQALGQLSHPNVVQVYEVGEVGEEIFIAMELVDGVSLEQWQGERHAWRACLDVYLQAGRGLAAAHAKGLIHRDFKPANCIRDTEGRVRVLDFGLVRAVDAPVSPNGRRQKLADSLDPPSSLGGTAPSHHGSGTGSSSEGSMLAVQLTADNAVVGTIAYMAPEQLVGDDADARSDQFSFCVALYEALYGHPPFGSNPQSTLQKLAMGQRIKPATASTRAVPRWLHRVLERGLAADPSERWPSMNALLQTLERQPRAATVRRASVFTAVVAAVGFYGASAYGEAQCDHDSRREALWGEAQRQHVREAMHATELPYADETWETIDRQLQVRTTAWADAAQSVCRANEARPEPVANSVQDHCLEREHDALASYVELVSASNPDTVRYAVDMVAALPSLEGCARALELDGPRAIAGTADWATTLDVARSLDRARLLEAAGQLGEGLSIASDAAARATALGPRWSAEAQLVEGHLLMSDHQAEAAETKLRGALGLAAEHGFTDLRVDSAATLGHVLGVEQGKTQAAMERLDSLETTPGISDRARALVWTHRGNVTSSRAEWSEAEGHYRQALQLLEAELGPFDLGLIEALDGLATVLRRQGKLDAALEFRARAVQIHERLQGADHPATAFTRANQAAIDLDQGNAQRAKQALEDAISTLERTLGSEHGDLASPHNTLAMVFAELGDHARAESEFLTAIRIWSATKGPDDAMVALARFNLGHFLSERGQTTKAIEQLSVAAEMFDRADPSDASVRGYARAQRVLGKAHRAAGDTANADEHFRLGLAKLRRHGLEFDPMTARILNGLGRTALRRGDAAEAADVHLRAVRAYDALLEGDERDRQVARTRLYVAEALAHQHQRSDALKQVDRAIALYERLLAKDASSAVAQRRLREARQLRSRIASAP
ncbi:MAG: serine/threonine-protein kinase [Myxococcota bacterium]